MKIRKPTPAGAAIAVVVLVLSLALVPGALAGKGGGGGGGTTSGGTIALVMVSDANGNGLPNFGDRVTFAVSTSATTMPWVTLDCYVNGVWVYKTSNGIFPTSLQQVFTLSSSAWTSGAASCTAYLQDWDSYSKHGTITNLASMSFQVSA